MLPIDEVVAPLAVHEVEKDLQRELQGWWHQGGTSTGSGTSTPDTTASSRPALFRSLASPLLLLFKVVAASFLHLARCDCPPWARSSAIPMLSAIRTV